jgi:hypothetical protein
MSVYGISPIKRTRLARKSVTSEVVVKART